MYYATNLLTGFSVVQSNLLATPPVNSYTTTVAVTSAGITPTLYDDWSTTGMYPRGWVLGEVFTTNNTLYAPVTSNAVTSANVVGYARFALTGPLVPEPAGVLLLLGIWAMGAWRGFST